MSWPCGLTLFTHDVNERIKSELFKYTNDKNRGMITERLGECHLAMNHFVNSCPFYKYLLVNFFPQSWSPDHGVCTFLIRSFDDSLGFCLWLKPICWPQVKNPLICYARHWGGFQSSLSGTYSPVGKGGHENSFRTQQSVIKCSKKKKSVWVRVNELASAFCLKPLIYWAAASHSQNPKCYGFHVFLGNSVFMEQCYVLWVSIVSHDYLGWLFLVLPVDHFPNLLSAHDKPRKNS